MSQSTGSLVNLVQGAGEQPAPKVGDPATILMWTDRMAATVIAVSPSGNEVTLQEDDAKRVDSNGCSEAQEYLYARNPQGGTWTYTRRKNGAFVRKGEPMQGGQRCRIGSRNTYHDFSF